MTTITWNMDGYYENTDMRNKPCPQCNDKLKPILDREILNKGHRIDIECANKHKYQVAINPQ
jgi:hypothetical protein